MITLISSELKLFDRYELSRIAIEFLASNLKRHKYNKQQKEQLVLHFRKRLLTHEEWDQTS